MTNWLNANAPAIQAVSASVTVLVTAILAVITWRYVRLTETLASAASFQRDAQSAARLAEHNELQTYIVVFVMNLVVLPKRPDERDRFLSSAATWSQLIQTLPRFQALTARLGYGEANTAGVVAASLMYIRDRIDDAVRRSENNWEDFPWEAWTSQIEGALSGLNELGSSLKIHIPAISDRPAG